MTNIQTIQATNRPQAPWNQIGTEIAAEHSADLDYAIRACGANFGVATQPLFRQVLDGANGLKLQGVPAQAVYRTDTSEVLGCVGPAYHPVQNDSAFEFFRPYIEAGDAKIENCGVLAGGRRVYVLAKITAEPVEIIPGDPIEQYALLSNAHDGTRSVKVGFTAIRVWCSNSLAYAHSSNESRLLSIRHTKGAEEALEKIQEVMNLARRQFEATAEKMATLAAKGVTEESLRMYVRKVFKTATPKSRILVPEEPKVRVVGERVRVDLDGEQETQAAVQAQAEAEAGEDAELAECARVEQAVIRLHEEGRGSEIPGVKGTMWGAYNAVTEYITHERGRSAENRVNSQWFGDGATISRRALDTALRIAA